MSKKLNIVASLLLTIFLFSGCATYYQKSQEFQQQFALGNLEQAQTFLNNQKKAEEKKDRLLYFLDRGVVEQMLGNYEASNAYFEKAYIYNQDYRNNLGADILATFSNPMLKPYKAEDFEVVLIHYYKAINFIQLNQLDAALVEVRRINISLNEMNDKYGDKKNRYKEDAFALTLMGIIYEAKGDVNNAFIAYRNAYEGYQSVYSESFNVTVPNQLKHDILRTAHANGFTNELKFYEKEFNINFEPNREKTSTVVFFWLNGLGPVKSEFSLNLASTKTGDGAFVFANDEEGFAFPYNVHTATNKADADGLNQIKFIRLAIPKYQTRTPLVNNAFIEVEGQKLMLEKVEDINKIAISTLQDRMLRETGKAISRLVVKQAAEYVVREQNQDLGSLVSALNAVTEKADTRNWQTLPYEIYYQRIELAPGDHSINFVTSGNNISEQEVTFKVNLKDNETVFRTFHSLESTPAHEQ